MNKYAITMLTLMVCLGLQPALGQDLITEPHGQPYLSKFWGGLRGGYLLKNQSLSKDPYYYLGSGFFAEATGGWRQQSFGWDLALGHLNIQRKPARTANNSLSVTQTLNGSPAAAAYFETALKSGATNGDYFIIAGNADPIVLSKNLSGIYALTGPRFWIGKNKLQGSVFIQGGIISRKFGYYLLSSSGAATNSFTYPAAPLSTDPKEPEPVKTTATVTAPVINYQQYGYTEALGSTLTDADRSSGQGFTEKSSIQFLARAGANLEYFISPKVSLSAGVDYFYLPSPQMQTAQNASGRLSYYTTPPGESSVAVDAFSFSSQQSGKSNLGFLGAALGIKFWFGNQKARSVAKDPEPPAAYKNLMVVVMDKPTGKPLDGVTVKIMRQGDRNYTEALTDESGSIPLIRDIDRGIYTITGTKNGVATTAASITIDEFTGKNKTIHKELIHNDLRFSLAGRTVTKNAQSPLPFIQTSLTNEDLGVARQQSSDSVGHFNYQLEHNTDYNVFAQHKGYFSNKEKVSTRGLNRSEVIYVNLELEVVELKQGNSIIVKDIYYDYDKWDIRPDAARVLDNLVQNLKDNPGIRIELSSYTDSRGSDAYNMTLSQRRADAAVQYLVSRGITADRLEAKGYGETKLLNECSNGVNCSETQHQKNRRTEMKVLE
ncbi:hypothetical protein GCM10027051_09700 [Niabella terrae]